MARKKDKNIEINIMKRIYYFLCFQYLRQNVKKKNPEIVWGIHISLIIDQHNKKRGESYIEKSSVIKI